MRESVFAPPCLTGLLVLCAVQHLSGKSDTPPHGWTYWCNFRLGQYDPQLSPALILLKVESADLEFVESTWFHGCEM